MQNVMEREYTISTWGHAGEPVRKRAARPCWICRLTRTRRDARLLVEWHRPRRSVRELKRCIRER